jgi:hypothetical protein
MRKDSNLPLLLICHEIGFGSCQVRQKSVRPRQDGRSLQINTITMTRGVYVYKYYTISYTMAHALAYTLAYTLVYTMIAYTIGGFRLMF